MIAHQNANPDTVVSWDFFLTKNFDVQILNYFFWTFQLSIQDWRYCRPVISIDGVYLYEKFKGKMLIAIEVDTEK